MLVQIWAVFWFIDHQINILSLNIYLIQSPCNINILIVQIKYIDIEVLSKSKVFPTLNFPHFFKNMSYWKKSSTIISYHLIWIPSISRLMLKWPHYKCFISFALLNVQFPLIYSYWDFLFGVSDVQIWPDINTVVYNYPYVGSPWEALYFF